VTGQCRLARILLYFGESSFGLSGKTISQSPKRFELVFYRGRIYYTIVTFAWVKIRFRMKRMEENLENSNVIHKISLT